MDIDIGNKRLLQQIEFIIEIDKMKSIFRQTKLAEGTRYENDAEHTWHLTVMAIILLEHANDRKLDLLKVINMLLIHDIVEIDAGDTFAYDVEGNKSKREREEKAANRIFGLLPEEQREQCLALWYEFEEMATSEAQYAAALDRLQPMLLNFFNKGETWREHGITSDRVIARNKHIENGSEQLWELAKGLVDKAVKRGYLESGSGADTNHT